MKKVIKKTVAKKYQKGGKVGSGAAKKAVADAKTNAEMKKLEGQGKPNSTTKGLYKGGSYDSKGAVKEKYDVSSKKGDRKIYNAFIGDVSRLTHNPTTGRTTSERMDTTGFSAGKKTFTKNTTVESKSGAPLQKSSKTVDRKDVPKTLKKMQSFRKGGNIKSKKK